MSKAVASIRVPLGSSLVRMRSSVLGQYQSAESVKKINVYISAENVQISRTLSNSAFPLVFYPVTSKKASLQEKALFCLKRLAILPLVIL